MQLQFEAEKQANLISKGEQKIESKDHMWKPAPIMGRDFNQQEVQVNS